MFWKFFSCSIIDFLKVFHPSCFSHIWVHISAVFVACHIWRATLYSSKCHVVVYCVRIGGRKSRGRFVKYDRYRVFPRSIFMRYELWITKSLMHVFVHCFRPLNNYLLPRELLSLSVEKIDAIDANEDTSVSNSGCCTGGDEPDEDIKEPSINSSPSLECFRQYV